jgi:hypothetical protein
VPVTSCILTVALSLFLSGRLDAGTPNSPGQSSEPLTRHVDAFRVGGVTKLDALLGLGKQEHLPLGIEYLDRDAVQTKVTVNLRDVTVEQVFGAVLGRTSGYKWRVDSGVANITHRGVLDDPKRNLLERRLRQFSIERVPLQDASLHLITALTLKLYPKTPTIFGDYPGGNLENTAGPLKMDDATVRQILNCLVGQARDAAWVVQVPPGQLDRLPSGGLWRVVEYDDSSIMTNAGEFFRRLIFESY